MFMLPQRIKIRCTRFRFDLRRFAMRLSSWMFLPLLVIVFLALIGFHSVHASAPKGTLLVANKGDNSLGLSDVAAGKHVAEVAQGGAKGQEVLASGVGKVAYGA